MLTLVMQKLRKVRMTVPSLVLLVLASYRTLTSGDSIQLVGVCAAIVPFFCIFKNFPEADREAGAVADVISSYIMTLVLMIVYLAWIHLLFLSIAADIVFISAVIPVCRGLQPLQRMIPGLVLTNAMLFFMMMAAGFVKTTALSNIPELVCGFCALVMVLCLGLVFAGYRTPKK